MCVCSCSVSQGINYYMNLTILYNPYGDPSICNKCSNYNVIKFGNIQNRITRSKNKNKSKPNTKK